MDLRGGSSTSTDGVSNGGTYHDHELRSNPHILERTLGLLPKKCLVLMRTYRVSRMRSYTWQRSPNTYNHYGKKSKLS